MVDSEDKRDFRRMDIDSEITVRSLTQNTTVIARARNLSASGLLFIIDREVAVGESFEVQLEPGRSGITLPFHARVEAIHVEEMVAEQEYAVGCKILEILKD